MLSHPTFYLAANGVRDPKSLLQALRLVRSHATGEQKTVHEIHLAASECSMKA